MKKLLFSLILVCAATAFAEVFVIKFPEVSNEEIEIKESQAIIPAKPMPIVKFQIRQKDPPQAPVEYFIFYNNASIGTFKSSDAGKDFKIGDNLAQKTLEIRLPTKLVQTFKIEFAPETPKANAKNPDKDFNSAAAYFLSEIAPTIDIKASQAGLTIENKQAGENAFTRFSGPSYIHLFFDQYGNSLLATVPQGVSDMQYVIHILYPSVAGEANPPTYTINQTSGDFSGSLVFNGSIPGNVLTLKSADAKETPRAVKWNHNEFLLSTSTSDIRFDIVRVSSTSSDSVERATLASYTIKMAKTYHGTFEIALLRTQLADPDYELLPSRSDPTQYVVKESSSGNRGMAAAMFTFYTSPIVLIENAAGWKKVPKYKLTGRNFLDDHAVYERIYPCIGVGLNDKAFENLFIGGCWELVRGGSVFVGCHYGRVSTFDTKGGFDFGKTVSSSADYDLRLDKKWDYALAFGVSLDVSLIVGLFSR